MEKISTLLSSFSKPRRAVVLLLAGTAPFSHAQDVLPVTPPGAQVLWLAADSGVSTDPSGNLTGWLDASGSGFDWLAGGGRNAGGTTLLTDQNTLPPSSGTTNSVSLVNFDGVPQHGLSLNTTGRLLDLSTFSVYIVANTTNLTGAAQDFISVFNGGNGAGWAIGPQDGNSAYTKFYTGHDASTVQSTDPVLGGSSFAFIGDTIDTVGNKNTLAGAYDQGSTNASRDNSDTQNNNNISPQGGEYVMGDLNGGGQPLMGNIAEILIYNDAGLSDDDIATQQSEVESYLANKYFAIPEPASISLLGLGALALFTRRRRA